MKDFDTTYEKLWRGATQETRTNSRKYWLNVYKAAKTNNNTTLLHTAEHMLAMQVLLESENEYGRVKSNESTK